MNQLLTSAAGFGYSVRKELSSSERSGIRTRQTCGFFTSIGFYGRVARLPNNSPRAKAAGRLQAVFKYLAAL